MKACIHTVLGAVALTLAGASHAGELFLPADPDGAADVVHGAKSAVVGSSRAMAPSVSERRVRIARQELAVARDDVQNFRSGRLLLNVREGVDLDVVVERTAPTTWGYSLSGSVVGGNVGFVTLVVHDEAVAGSIWTPDSSYELHYMGGGIHALRDVTDAPPIECGGALPSELAAADENVQASIDDHRGDNVSVVDILVVWTQAAGEERGGGEQEMLALIDMLVAYINDAFERSGALVSLNLVGAEMNPEDVVGAPAFYAPERRNALGADLVHVIRGSNAPGVRGRADLLGHVSWSRGSSRVFAHEIGHNFGVMHDRSATSGGPVGPHGFPHAFTAEDCTTSTIVSYSIGCRSKRVPWYASPWRYHPEDGRPLGVTRFSRERGARGPADAVFAMNRNRHLIASFRSRDGS